MSLNLNWEKCKSDSVKTYPYEAGVCLMSIGLNEITKKNVREAEFRIEFYKRLFVSLPLRNVTAEDLIGLESNVSTETRSKWVKRMVSCFARDCGQ